MYFHCYSPTKLSDSVQTGDLNNQQSLDRGIVYQWRYSPSDVPVLFVFPTNFQLNNTILYYESGPLLRLPNLTFYHVPNDFEIWNYSNLSQLEQLAEVVQLGERLYSTMARSSYGVYTVSLPFKHADILTKKLLMVITFTEREVDFSVSEIEFNMMSENCPPLEGNVIDLGITITMYNSSEMLQLMD